MLSTLGGVMIGPLVGLSGWSGFLLGAVATPLVGLGAWTLGHLLFEAWASTPYLKRANLGLIGVIMFPLAVAVAVATFLFWQSPPPFPNRLANRSWGPEALLIYGILLASFIAIILGMVIRARYEAHRAYALQSPLRSQAYESESFPPMIRPSRPEHPSWRRWSSLAWLFLCLAFGTWFTVGYPDWGLKGMDDWLAPYFGGYTKSATWIPSLASAFAVSTYALPVMIIRGRIGNPDRRRMEIEDAASETYYLGFLLSLVGIAAAMFQFDPQKATFMADTFGKCGGAIGSTFAALVIRLAALHMLGPDPKANRG